MDKVLSDEELDVLMKLWQGDNDFVYQEVPADEMIYVVDRDLHRHFFRMQQSLEAIMKIDGTAYAVKITNMGLGGMFVLSDIDVPVGKKIQIIIKLKKPRGTIDTECFVCWQKKIDDRVTGLGVRFPALKTDHIWLLVSNMKRLQEDIRKAAETDSRQLTLNFG